MRAPSPTKWLVSGVVTLGGLIAGCGASYTSIYEGDVRFEHCYRLDEEPRVPIAHKRACWQSWTRHFTYGQTRDRVEYAMARERTLAEAMRTACDATPRGMRPVAAPTPTNAFAPPPRTMPRDGGAPPAMDGGAANAPGATGSPTLANAPGSSCANGCGGAWTTCTSSCDGAACDARCDERYRGCMRGCF